MDFLKSRVYCIVFDEKNNTNKINKPSNQTCKVCSKCFRKLKIQTHRFVISCWIRRARYWPIIHILR